MGTCLRLVALMVLVSGCTYNYAFSGEAECLAIARDSERFGDLFPRGYARWLRFWQSTPYCQGVRAQWAAANTFVPPPFTQLLEVRPMRCVRNGLNPALVDVTARFRNPAGSPTVDPFDVIVGSDLTQAPGPANVGLMVPIDANGNELGPGNPRVPFPQDLTGNTPAQLSATLSVDVQASPSLQPPQFPIRIVATVSARQTTQTGPQIVGKLQRSCDVQ